jgi:hypothetical protein
MKDDTRVGKLSVIGCIREVVIAIATRMAYFRVCLTTGSEG